MIGFRSRLRQRRGGGEAKSKEAWVRFGRRALGQATVRDGVAVQMQPFTENGTLTRY